MILKRPKRAPCRPSEAPKITSDGVGGARKALRRPTNFSRSLQRPSRSPRKPPRGLNSASRGSQEASSSSASSSF
eukprot:2184306-Pyramimonas_sp.AAC.1